MNIDFPGVDDNFIKNQVSTGHYTNATELVRDAVRRLREASEARRDRLLRALELGQGDIDAGRLQDYSPNLLAEIKTTARKYATEGRKPNPDVTG